MPEIPAHEINELLIDICTKMGEDLGWDTPPMLGLLDFHRPTGLMQIVPLAVGIQGNPGDYLEYMAERTAETADLGKAIPGSVKGFYGMILACEAWGMLGTPAQLEAFQRSNARIEGHPDAVEMRTLYVCDIEARSFFVKQVRGMQAEATSADHQIGGSTFESLRRITVNVVKAVPELHDRLTDLNTLFVPQHEDMATIREFHQNRPTS